MEQKVQKKVLDTVQRLDKQRADQKEKSRKRSIKAKAEVQKVRDAMIVLQGDKNYQIIIRHLAKISGQFKSAVVVSTDGEAYLTSTLHNASRRSVYLDMRRLMTDEARMLIESKGEEDAIENAEE